MLLTPWLCQHGGIGPTLPSRGRRAKSTIHSLCFKYTDSLVNEPLIRYLYSGHFLAQARNLIFIGGTGISKTHLSIAIASPLYQARWHRGRYFSVIDLVNQLEQEKELGKSGVLASRLFRLEFVMLDKLGYLPFSKAGGALLFHLIA